MNLLKISVVLCYSIIVLGCVHDKIEGNDSENKILDNSDCIPWKEMDTRGQGCNNDFLFKEIGDTIYCCIDIPFDNDYQLNTCETIGRDISIRVDYFNSSTFSFPYYCSDLLVNGIDLEPIRTYSCYEINGVLRKNIYGSSLYYSVNILEGLCSCSEYQDTIRLSNVCFNNVPVSITPG